MGLSITSLRSLEVWLTEAARCVWVDPSLAAQGQGCGEEGRKCSCCVPGVPQAVLTQEALSLGSLSQMGQDGRVLPPVEEQLSREPFPQAGFPALLPH